MFYCSLQPLYQWKARHRLYLRQEFSWQGCRQLSLWAGGVGRLHFFSVFNIMMIWFHLCGKRNYGQPGFSHHRSCLHHLEYKLNDFPRRERRRKGASLLPRMCGEEGACQTFTLMERAWVSKRNRNGLREISITSKVREQTKELNI